MKKGLWAFFLSIGLFGIDWGVKFWSEDRACRPDQWFDLCGVVNEGFVFSFTFSWWAWALALISFIVLLGFYLKSLQQPWSGWIWSGVSLLVAGGSSNTLDRLIFGGVRDYVAIANGVFNAADIFVLLGVLILVTRTIERDAQPSS